MCPRCRCRGQACGPDLRPAVRPPPRGRPPSQTPRVLGLGPAESAEGRTRSRHRDCSGVLAAATKALNKGSPPFSDAQGAKVGDRELPESAFSLPPRVLTPPASPLAQQGRAAGLAPARPNAPSSPRPGLSPGASLSLAPWTGKRLQTWQSIAAGSDNLKKKLPVTSVSVKM